MNWLIQNVSLCIRKICPAWTLECFCANHATRHRQHSEAKQHTNLALRYQILRDQRVAAEANSNVCSSTVKEVRTSRVKSDRTSESLGFGCHIRVLRVPVGPALVHVHAATQHSQVLGRPLHRRIQLNLRDIDRGKATRSQDTATRHPAERAPL